jgi:hypothetical protein
LALLDCPAKVVRNSAQQTTEHVDGMIMRRIAVELFIKV